MRWFAWLSVPGYLAVLGLLLALLGAGPDFATAGTVAMVVLACGLVVVTELRAS